MMLGRAIFPAGLGDEDTFWMQEGWIAGVGGLLILLICGFVRASDGA